MALLGSMAAAQGADDDGSGHTAFGSEKYDSSSSELTNCEFRCGGLRAPGVPSVDAAEASRRDGPPLRSAVPRRFVGG